MTVLRSTFFKSFSFDPPRPFFSLGTQSPDPFFLAVHGCIRLFQTLREWMPKARFWAEYIFSGGPSWVFHSAGPRGSLFFPAESCVPPLWVKINHLHFGPSSDFGLPFRSCQYLMEEMSSPLAPKAGLSPLVPYCPFSRACIGFSLFFGQLEPRVAPRPVQLFESGLQRHRLDEFWFFRTFFFFF